MSSADPNSEERLDLATAARILQAFALPEQLGEKIRTMETAYAGQTASDLNRSHEHFGLDSELFRAAARIKEVAGQINVVIHAIGILLSLPYILDPGEVVEYLSLGAGNIGRAFDLETDKQVGEFKFITWRGGPEAMRKKQLFKDLFYLAEYDKPKRRRLYLLNKDIPLKFLQNSRMKLTNILNRDETFGTDFLRKYGDRFEAVRDYYAYVKDRVEIIDLIPLVPELRGVDPGQLREADAIDEQDG